MKKIFLLGILFVLISSFSLHKFYVSVTQINYVAEKKTIQITTRLFIDDLNNALGKKHNKIIYLGSTRESKEEVELLKNYINSSLTIKVDGKPKEITFLDKEIEDDVMICYLTIKNISKVKTLEVKNQLFFDFLSDQQHIIHTNVNTNKKSALLTTNHPKELLKY